MRIEIIDTIDKFQHIEADWNRLLTRYPGNNPFLTFEWMISWLEVFGKELRLFVIQIRNEKGTIGLAPFAVNNKKLLTFIGYPQNDYADIIIDPDYPEALEEIIKTVYAHKSEWNRVILDQFPGEKSQFAALQRVLGNLGGSFREEPADSCPAMVLDDLVAAKKIYYKRKIAQHINWFQKEGDFRYHIYKDLETVLQRLEDLFTQHIYRWRETATPSYFTDEKMKQFYRKLLSNMHSPGVLQFSSLTFDDKFLAFYINFEYENRLYLYKTSYNPDFAKKSPGDMILRYLFDYALEKNIAELDFGRGDEGYKGRFANLVRQNRRLIIYRGRLAKTWAGLFYKARYSRVADLLYRNEPVQNAKHNFLKFLRAGKKWKLNR